MSKQIYIVSLVIIFSILPAKASDFNDFDMNCSSCRYLLNIEKNIDSIKTKVLIWTKENTSCRNDLIDSLTDRFINSGNESFFYCLVAVCNVADKSLYSSLLESNGMMFYGIFENYLKKLFFYQKYYHEEHCFVKYLVEALSLAVYTAKNQKKELTEIEKFIEIESKNYNLSDEQRQYLRNLQNRIDPKIWENE